MEHHSLLQKIVVMSLLASCARSHIEGHVIVKWDNMIFCKQLFNKISSYSLYNVPAQGCLDNGEVVNPS